MAKKIRAFLCNKLHHLFDQYHRYLYDAPVALCFYGSPCCDPAGPVIAATYAMPAAESLGLGTCMIGGNDPFIQ